ncbi:MAG: hypothetical protein Q7J23_02245 [Nitrosomonas sp.]|nr:hypothetical protein [Nitrosomonas sp.]
MKTEPRAIAGQIAQHLDVVKSTVYRWRERKGLIAPTGKGRGAKWASLTNTKQVQGDFI